jgi:hypothetical protein
VVAKSVQTAVVIAKIEEISVDMGEDGIGTSSVLVTMITAVGVNVSSELSVVPAMLHMKCISYWNL